MANDRLYIACDECQESVYLARSMGVGWQMDGECDTRVRRFLDCHDTCPLWAIRLTRESDRSLDGYRNVANRGPVEAYFAERLGESDSG